jgi:NAD(P)-dependent dehydrogenase (short-subunit alcohol dehydrogenase family)
VEISTKGLRVLITGGASGIGRKTAEAFAGSGAEVMICDVAPEHLSAFAADNPHIGTAVADVADHGAVARLFDAVQSRLGGLDVLVNNAGITGPTGRVDAISIEDWERTLAVDITGMFSCTRLAVPLLKAAGGGSIINLSSAAGRLPFAWRTPYSAAKWAVVGFTLSLALELGPNGIRCNALQPGYVAGERHDRNAANRAALLGITFDEIEEAAKQRVAMRRFIEPEEVANMAVFLASDLGRSISGQTIGICGYLQHFGS